MTVMSLLPDSSLTHAACSGKARSDAKPCANGPVKQGYSRLRSISVPSLSSVVRDSLSWAGDTLYPRRDAKWRKLKEEQKETLGVGERKQVMYYDMENARTYEDWEKSARELDRLEGNDAWKETEECDEYNAPLVRERLQQLEEARETWDISRMLFLVRTALTRDLGFMGRISLYRHSHWGTKNLIERYISTAVDSISALVDLSGNNRCDRRELRYILDQLLAAKQAFGQSALLFSGGATFGMSHIGVLKTLYDHDMLPRVISGASAGSIVCAVFCSHTDDELPELLDKFSSDNLSVFGEPGQEPNIFQRISRFYNHGSFMDISHLSIATQSWLGNLTFQEAYNRTRRVLNICVSCAGIFELPRILNYITAPNVLIWSAVTVSCSVPFVFSPPALMSKDPATGLPVPWSDVHGKYIDGSVDSDLPMDRLSEMFNVNHFIVSQVNPHVVPFLPKDEGAMHASSRLSPLSQPWVGSLVRFTRDEIVHRINTAVDMGLFPTALTKLASIVDQKYSGDITIYPEIPLRDFPRVLTNPTSDFIAESCLRGQRATWPKIARIRNHLAIEMALDSAIQRVRARLAFCRSEVDLLRLSCMMTVSGDSKNSRKGEYSNYVTYRRSSYSHEFEIKKGVLDNHRSRPLLRRTQSGASPARLGTMTPANPTETSVEDSPPAEEGYFPDAQEPPFYPGIDDETFDSLESSSAAHDSLSAWPPSSIPAYFQETLADMTSPTATDHSLDLRSSQNRPATSLSTNPPMLLMTPAKSRPKK
ncbi:putative Patatin family phospholipase [Aspergillus candidus]|uniref:Patatin-like phospholipase domain-containing protein n=1 Tax=Aspergillus candidus TaxID=41067 RepID=A0A2I2FDG4_ASPCN|nr:patatin-domain-containing protein [Aspergillus candidus]PLB38686.1 patatin-domain-containing protein [Aspergillus candidus]